MRLTIAAFGKLKSPGLREAADHYLKMLRTWNKAEEIELKPRPVSEKSAALRARIQEQETEQLLESVRGIGGRTVLVLLDERGAAWPTEKWAEQFRRWMGDGTAEAVFCIGSSMGFSDELRKKAALTLSLGPQTLSHELARVVLYEQLYRAHAVINGHPYHNAD
jgi:23S rRNA (pseudouridine1915-N3)-methyltransferase